MGLVKAIKDVRVHYDHWQRGRNAREHDRVEAVLKQITYKPGSRITLFYKPIGKEFQLHLLAQVMDRNNPTSMITLQRDVTLKTKLPTHKIVRQIFEEFVALEAHETAEFFKFKNDRIFDPHLDKKAFKALKKQSKREWKWWQRFNWEEMFVSYLATEMLLTGFALVLEHYKQPINFGHINFGQMALGGLTAVVIVSWLTWG